MKESKPLGWERKRDGNELLKMSPEDVQGQVGVGGIGSVRVVCETERLGDCFWGQGQ